MAKTLKKGPAAPKKPNYTLYVISAAVLIAAAYFIYTSMSDKKSNYTLNTDRLEKLKDVAEPQFKKQGELEFISAQKSSTGNKILGKIEIEIADKDSTRMQGLMYRKSMSEDKGMLFIFPISEPQSFWMKNTIISLDIIFVNEDKEIVKIHKNTVPYSKSSNSSFKKSMYVVEVVAGFTDKYKIAEGDRIDYKTASYQK
ncbi:MAG: DUF192 domain-containing protein [Ignavibacteriae bacterium]|nr:DUF192 domain-containing protein [Ignavibacteriota bacterium]